MLPSWFHHRVLMVLKTSLKCSEISQGSPNRELRKWAPSRWPCSHSLRSRLGVHFLCDLRSPQCRDSKRRASKSWVWAHFEPAGQTSVAGLPQVVCTHSCSGEGQKCGQMYSATTSTTVLGGHLIDVHGLAKPKTPGTSLLFFCPHIAPSCLTQWYPDRTDSS